MSNHRFCCCGGCTSQFRVFKPCDETQQELDILPPVLHLDIMEELGLDEETVYLHDSYECESYCGKFVCINVDDDQFCRPFNPSDDPFGELNQCPGCREYTPLWDPPLEESTFRLLDASTGQDRFTPVEGCCDELCPTVCDEYGSTVEVCSGCSANGCFDIGVHLINYNLTFNVADDMATTVLSCGAINTTSSTSIVYNQAGIVQPSDPSCRPTTMLIGIVEKRLYTTDPWKCGEGLIDDSGGGPCTGSWCASFDQDPTDIPPNTAWTYQKWLIEIGCGTASFRTDFTSPDVDATLPGFNAYRPNSSEVQTGCGYDGFVPGPPGGSSTSIRFLTNNFGWGATNALVIDRQFERRFNAVTDCSPGTIESATAAVVPVTIQLRVTVSDMPDPCGDA